MFDLEFPLKHTIAPYTADETNERRKAVSLKLSSLTGGLLEVRAGQVRVFPKTALDYVLNGDRLTKIKQHIPKIDASFPHFRLDLAQLRFDPTWASSGKYGALSVSINQIWFPCRGQHRCSPRDGKSGAGLNSHFHWRKTICLCSRTWSSLNTQPERIRCAGISEPF